jgi:hypothetical protein
LTVSSWALTLPTSSFASGTLTKTVWDGDFTNAFTTNSSWVITYISNNTWVATVDSVWKVHLVWAWSATITANQAATATYSADTDTYSLTVEALPPPSNNPPTWPDLSDVTREDHWWWAPIDPINTSNGVSDAEGNALTYSATWLPAWLSINPSTWEITWTYDAWWPETFTITVTVSDWNGWTLVRSFVLTFTDQW